MFSPLTAVWAQQKYSSRVIDDKTGEALPYASIYIAEGNGTLTNHDGEFTVLANQDDTLRISYVGYEKMFVKASDLKSPVRLKPFTMEMEELQVKVDQRRDILKKLINQLAEDFDKAKKADGIYFFRTYMVSRKRYPEMTEGFMIARGAVNLRDPYLISGENRSADPNKERYVYATNVFLLYSLGPQIHGRGFWQFATTPLKSYFMMNQKFRLSTQSFVNEEGHRIYVFHLKYKNKVPKGVNHNPVMDGTVYVDSATNHMLRFDGNLLHVTQRVSGNRETASMTIHAEYSYEHGYAEVSHISVEGGNQDMLTRSIVFRVEDYNGKRKLGTMNNLMNDVDKAGFDPELWKRYDIIQRAKAEEQLAKIAKNDSILEQ